MLSVRPTSENGTDIKVKIMSITGATVGLVEGITEDFCLIIKSVCLPVVSICCPSVRPFEPLSCRDCGSSRKDH